jgi:hypothetical protein
VLGLAVALTGVGPGAGAAEAATSTETCGFAAAGTGTYARSLCWFDLSHYDAAQADSPGGQPMKVMLPGGYTITFTLNTTGGPVHPSSLPTYSGAYLRNNGHYTGVSGKPALYQSSDRTTSKATLSNIIVVNAAGKQVSGYSFVGADAEATDAGESITWTSDSPLGLISTIENACDSGSGLTGTGTTTVKCPSNQTSTKTGTAILAALHPTTISQTMVGSGQQAVAFGVLISPVQLNKVVASRVNPTDSFRVSVIGPTGTVLGSADTGPTVPEPGLLVATAAVAGLVAVVATALTLTSSGWGTRPEALPPRPARSLPSATTGMPSRVPRTTAPGARLVIPAIHVDAPVVPVGATGSQGSAALSIPDDIRAVGWWDGTVREDGRILHQDAPSPGQPGVAVIAGHVDSPRARAHCSAWGTSRRATQLRSSTLAGTPRHGQSTHPRRPASRPSYRQRYG